MPGLPVYHQVGVTTGATNAPNQSGGSVNGTTGSHARFVIWLIVLGVIIPGIVLGTLDFAGWRFVFKHR